MPHHAGCKSCLVVLSPRPRVLQKVREQRMAVFGEDRLGMELDTREWIPTVTQSHHRAVIGPGGDLEVGREIFAVDHQGVVTGRHKWTRDAAEDRLLAVRNARNL